MIKLDGTSGKNNLGTNTNLSVSMAVAKASAQALKIPLYSYLCFIVPQYKNDIEFCIPVPMLNEINDGSHADNTNDSQEFMFMPIGAKTMRQVCQIASEYFNALGKLLKSKNLNTSKGDEGG